MKQLTTIRLRSLKHSHHCLPGIVAILMLVIVPGPIQSAEGESSGAKNQHINALEEIVITARKRTESLQDVPEAMSVFSAERIDQAGLRTMYDFTQLTPNITINGGSGAGYPNIMVRGLAQAQGGEAPLAFVVDGVQVSHPAFINRDYGHVEQVEILRGPQGSLYGRNAIGGAINITTRQPTNEFAGRATVSYGKGDTIYANGDISGPIVDDKIFFRLGASYKNTDGQIRNQTNGQLVDEGNSVYLNGRLIFNVSEQLTVDVRANYGSDNLGGLSAEVVPNASWNNYDPSFFQNNPRQTDDRDLWDVSAKIEYEGDYFTITSVTGYSEMDELQTGDADFFAAPIVLQNVDLIVEAFTQELRLSSPSDGRLRWLVGGFYQDRDTNNFLDIPVDDGTGSPLPGIFAVRSHDVGTSESWAVFGSASYDILPKLELTLGIRYDEDKRTSEDEIFAGSATSSNFTSTQPKIQLAWKPTDNLNIYATYSEGFGSGGFNAFIAGPAARLYDAQTSENYEVGVKGSFGFFDYSANLFRVDYDNQQLFFITASPPSQNIVNIDETRVNGAELEITASPMEGLVLAGALGWTDSEIRSFAPDPTVVGNRTPQAYEYTLNLSGQYIYPLTGTLDLRTYISYRRQSSQFWDAANTLRTDPQDFVNLRVFLETGRWSIGFYGENLTDARFATQAAANALPGGLSLRIPSLRRSYGVEASYRF